MRAYFGCNCFQTAQWHEDGGGGGLHLAKAALAERDFAGRSRQSAAGRGETRAAARSRGRAASGPSPHWAQMNWKFPTKGASALGQERAVVVGLEVGGKVADAGTAWTTMADVFVSYSSEDRPAAQAIAQALSGRGRSVWWDRSIRAGEDFFDVIEHQLDAAKCVVVLWSHASVSSRWVRAEATEALEKGKLIPLLISDCQPPLFFRQLQLLAVDPFGHLDIDAAVDALDREVAMHLGTREDFDRLPVLPVRKVQASLRPTEARAATPQASVEDIVRSFLEGASLQVDRDELGDLDVLFRKIGELVHASIEGAGNFLRTQVYFKRELRIENTVIAARSNNPLKFVSDYQDLARVLLLQRSAAFMDGPAAVREAMQEAQNSYLAHFNAMRSSVLEAFDDLLQAQQARVSDASAWWPWSEVRRLRANLAEQVEAVAALRKAFSDGDGSIPDAYTRAYVEQMRGMREEREERARRS